MKTSEETVSFTYSFLRRKLNKSDLDELLLVEYATKNNEIFQLTESQAKKFNLI